jgi:hypothetical protein
MRQKNVNMPTVLEQLLKKVFSSHLSEVLETPSSTNFERSRRTGKKFKCAFWGLI